MNVNFEVDETKAKALAIKLARVIFDEYQKTPSTEEFGVILASILILKDTIDNISKEHGVTVLGFKKEFIQ